jgi:hypothetical protein
VGLGVGLNAVQSFSGKQGTLEGEVVPVRDGVPLGEGVGVPEAGVGGKRYTLPDCVSAKHVLGA